MNQLAVAVLKVLTDLPPFSYEPVIETQEERVIRLTPVAEVIVDVSNIRPSNVDQLTMISVLITLGKFESGNFAKYVGEGKCMSGPVGMRCDPKDGVSRARSYFQHWQVSCPKIWDTEPGSQEELVVAAKCTAGRLTGAYNRCRSRNPNVWAGAFSGYRSSSCNWKPANDRANSVNEIKFRLAKALTNSKS